MFTTPEFTSPAYLSCLSSRLIYLIAYSISPFGCLLDISHLIHSKQNSWCSFQTCFSQSSSNQQKAIPFLSDSHQPNGVILNTSLSYIPHSIYQQFCCSVLKTVLTISNTTKLVLATIITCLDYDNTLLASLLPPLSASVYPQHSSQRGPVKM